VCILSIYQLPFINTVSRLNCGYFNSILKINLHSNLSLIDWVSILIPNDCLCDGLKARGKFYIGGVVCDKPGE
jgi:hypothetical protein